MASLTPSGGRSPEGGSSFLEALQSPSWFNHNGLAAFYQPPDATTTPPKKTMLSNNAQSKSSPSLTPPIVSKLPVKPAPRPATACDDVNDSSPFRQAAAQARRAQAQVREDRERASMQTNDVDGNGKLDVRELMMLLGVDTEGEALFVMQQLDVDGDGELDLTELAALRERASEKGLLGAQQKAKAAAKAADLARASAMRARKAQTETMEQLQKHMTSSLGLSSSSAVATETQPEPSTTAAPTVPADAPSQTLVPAWGAEGGSAVDEVAASVDPRGAPRAPHLRAVGYVPIAAGRLGEPGRVGGRGGTATTSGPAAAETPSAAPDGDVGALVKLAEQADSNAIGGVGGVTEGDEDVAAAIPEMPAERQAVVDKLFETFANGAAVIDVEQVEGAKAGHIDIGPSKENVLKRLRDMDTNSDGEVDTSEWQHYFQAVSAEMDDDTFSLLTNELHESAEKLHAQP